MKIIVKRKPGGATISIRAKSDADRKALTEAVMSGSLMRALNNPKEPAK